MLSHDVTIEPSKEQGRKGVAMFRFVSAVCVAALFFAPDAVAAEPPVGQWLRGSGDSLELCLRGEVLDAGGQPATDVQLVGSINGSLSDISLKPALNGHRFSIWVPVNQPAWYSVLLRASSEKDDRVAYARFNQYQFRQAAIDGLKLTLESPLRHVDVEVTFQGQPVSGATVKADVGFGTELRATTGDDGIARFALLPLQEMHALTAWTDDHRVGGFSFDRSPPRDPDASEQVIDLSKGRDQRIRFVTNEGTPVANLKCGVQIATPPPHYNYIGTTDHSQMTTDAAGEVVYRWFPDWDESHFYADIDETKWVLDGEPKTVDGIKIITVKQRKPRKVVTGRVVTVGTDASPGGFYVSFRSFQGERESHSDIDTAFSNPDGSFSVSVLPDATYCAYVQDEKWVGKLFDVLAYESSVDKGSSPELSIAKGQPVEIAVTSGPHRQPVANVTVSLRREHHYTWLEDGEERSGVGGPQWWVTTDESGKATTHTLPGTLEVSIYSPLWRTEKSIDVVADQPATIALHREIDEKRSLTGMIVPDADLEVTLENVEIRVASVDGNFRDEQNLKCTPDGEFTFDTYAAEVAVYASTPDGKAAGSTVTKKLAFPIELNPTTDYQGQLLGRGDQPAVGHPVRAYIRLESNRLGERQHANMFDVKKITTKTDQHGNFTLEGIPTQTNVTLLADALDGTNDSVYLGRINLKPNELRPRAVSRLEK